MTRIDHVLERAVRDLGDAECRWALVGGLAVSARVEPRFTRDIDLVVSVDDDAGAEAAVFALQGRGYQLVSTVEQDRAGRLATVRFVPAGEDEDGVVLDLLFASSGIEPEVIAAATRLEILPEIVVPVAAVGHLLALKILSRDDDERPQDIADIRALLRVADDSELDRARAAVALIEQRGYHRGRRLADELERLAARPTR